MASRSELIEERIQERPGTLPADFGEWDNGAPPATLPAGFEGFDPVPVLETKGMQGARAAQDQAQTVVSAEDQSTPGEVPEDAKSGPQLVGADKPEESNATQAPLKLFAAIGERRRWWWR